mgnify:FL=1
MTRFTLCAALIALPTLASADAQLDRFEDLSERTSAEMSMVFVRAIEAKGGDTSELKEAIPDHTWDNAHRDAGACMMGKYTDLIGSDGVDEMLTRMEDMIPQLETATLDNISSFSALPDGITTEQTASIMQECKMMDLVLKRMKESGYSDALMKAYGTVPSGD